MNAPAGLVNSPEPFIFVCLNFNHLHLFRDRRLTRYAGSLTLDHMARVRRVELWIAWATAQYILNMEVLDSALTYYRLARKVYFAIGG